MTDVAPKYTSRDLAKQVGVPLTTLRRWLGVELFQPTPFRGPFTVYGPRHLDEALAIVRLRRDNLTYQAIRTRLRGMTDAQLALFVRPQAQAQVPVAPVLPVAPAPTPAAAAPERPRDKVGYRSTAWERIVLLPGLELSVRSDAGALLRHLAGEIYARYGVATEGRGEEPGVIAGVVAGDA